MIEKIVAENNDGQSGFANNFSNIIVSPIPRIIMIASMGLLFAGLMKPASAACSGAASLWPSNPAPAVAADPDTDSVELGVKFRSSTNGFICGIRFYKGGTNTGTHIGKLWSSTGTLLASATFQNETASGWQQVSFASPVAITANTPYVASYVAPVGRYSVDAGYFGSAVTSGPLTAPGNTEAGGNGVYRYGTGGFPTDTFQSTNYWVDVLFSTDTGPDTTPPTLTSRSPVPGATGVATGTPVAATFSEAMDPATLTTATFQLQAGSNPVPATVNYNSLSRTATLTPNGGLAANTAYTATVKGGSMGVKDAAGNPLVADVSWTFTTGVNPCSIGGNAIVCENSKAGNPASEWDVAGAGSSNIQGYATDISVNKGETVHFKIKTPSTNYRLDIYRMGYYGGNGARKIATVAPSANLPQTQPACLNNSATGLIDCGNWAESASWAVPTDAVSGIYFAKAVQQDSAGQASHIVFIVRDDASTSDILFQTSDTTWQAYNTYGGNSLYTGSPAGRAYKVSYNRPFNTRSVDNGQDWVFNAEYPMVRWLEANGYNVSYFSGVDSDRRGNLITNHKVFLSVGHDEYWSNTQRTNVEVARDAGTHLGFFSGNEIFWKTRWENNITNSAGNLGAASYRTLVCYKETHANNKIDPLPNVWTGTWRDPRFSPPADGGRPENALTGTIFTVNDGATTRIIVPAEEGQMRFWRNTGIANLPAGSSASLPNGTLGYEWDEDLDNGFRPAGLVRLSTTIVNNAPVLTDFGSTYGSGTANHALTLYRAASDALVFGAGSVQWIWGLDSNHDRAGTPTDTNMQQATVNLFADMNVQPATLQSGLQAATESTDIASPISTLSVPASGATVPVGSNVTISGSATDSGGGRVGGIEVSVDGGLTWHPASGRSSWTYNWRTPSASTTVNIKSRAVDDSGNLETAGPGITVNVGSGSGPDTTPPTLTSRSPAPGATGVATGTAVTATFSEAMDPATLTTATFQLQAGSNPVPATVNYNSISRTATLTPNGALAANTAYTATVKGGSTGVKDAAGNPLAADVSWTFTTASGGGGVACSGAAVSLWPGNPTPGLVIDPDTVSVELGVKFQSNTNGFVCGIRFYKGGTNTGTHIGKLWSSTGTLLASATFQNETASGWQQVSFASPVAIMANTLYVASYLAPVGRYSADVNYFNSAVTSGPLTAPGNAAAGGNGVYRYGTGGFPTDTFQASNYWVDVLFTPN